jgi:DNA-binding transcriptional ArsR family regulator
MAGSQGLLLRDGKALSASIVGEKALAVLSEDRLRILRALAEEPKYPTQVARELRMQVQTVYYHMRLLEENELVQFVEHEEKGGATAKKFAAAGDALAVVVNERNWKPYSAGKLAKPPAFLEHFVSGGHLDAKMVLGSPDAHGKYRARGSELCAAELAMFLGNYATFSYPLYYLDTEITEKAKRGNLIVIGGPKVNTLAAELNPHLRVQFDERSFAIRSQVSGKTYEENVGVIEITENPFHRGKKIIILAGMNHLSTRVAVLALLKERKKLEEGNLFDASVKAKVVQGFDEDGDGIVDAVEVLE